MRFGINEKAVHHAPESRILELAEQLVAGDKMEIGKELGNGYYIIITESPSPNPPRDFEG